MSTLDALKNALPGADEDAGLSEQDILAHLSDEERERFLAVQETFSTDGWRILAELATARGLSSGIEGSNAGAYDEGVATRCARAYGALQVWKEIEGWADAWYNTFAALAAQRIEDSLASDPDDDPERE